MSCYIFDKFRLVGGTSLSLQLGHRVSVDIDLFTDEPYGSIDFTAIDQYLRTAFPYVSGTSPGGIAMGASYFVGNNKDECIKLDLYYADNFIQPAFLSGNIRMATVEEIIAMKIDVVQRGGRKKDFWDIHELLDEYSPQRMIALHKQRFPYNHDEALIRSNFTNFTNADDDFEPLCLRGRYWELIKLDIINALRP